PVGVTHHRVLSCSDFPPIARATGDHLSAPTLYARAYRNEPVSRRNASHCMRRHAAHEYTAVMSIRPRLIAWAEPRHEAMLRAIIADYACDLIGISSARASDAAALAHTFNTESLPDLRQAVLSPDAEVIWLATPVTLDAALQRAIREHGLLVLTSE